MIFKTVNNEWAKVLTLSVGDYVTAITVKGSIITHKKVQAIIESPEKEVIDILNEQHAIWAEEQILMNKMSDLHLRKAQAKKTLMELENLELV